MADNNVFILFEEIKTALKGINNKLEELPKSVAQVPQGETNTQDLSPIKEAVAETAKAQSEDIKGLLAKHWKAYAQISTVILQHLDTIKKVQDKQRVQQEQQQQEHIHKHSFDIKSKKVFSFFSSARMRWPEPIRISIWPILWGEWTLWTAARIRSGAGKTGIISPTNTYAVCAPMRGRTIRNLSSGLSDPDRLPAL